MHHVMASDTAGRWDAGAVDVTASGAGGRAGGGGWRSIPGGASPDTCTDELVAAVERVRGRSVDDLDEVTIKAELHAIEQVSRRLQARSARLAAALVERRARRAIDAGERRRVGQTTRDVQQELREQLGWTPSQAKQATQVGGRLDTSDDTREALDEGRLPVRHAALLDDTLRFVEEDDVRRRLERELVAAAASQDAVAFGRTCRRALAEADHRAGERADARRRQRRQARTWQTEDGMWALSGQWSGLDGETVATALHAFRRPDAPGEHRTPVQATADAMVDLAKAALDGGDAPSSRGVRPHVQVTVPWQAILADHGVAEASWSGPMPFTEIRRLLSDCGVGRLLVDPDQVPVEAGKAVRTVPAGLSRILDARDGGCIADGCDMPAQWCQVMHLDVPYRLHGRLTPETAAYGCSHHHTRFDHHGWQVTWVDGCPVLHHPDRPPSRALDPPGDPPGDPP